ncbi:MAG: VCBS repeat-containing protein [Cyclobacteriaceae bacterium]|nr:VCBS repeat-containing protein [Cyclobacteriaceae bacterium]
MKFPLIVFCLIVTMGCDNKDRRFRIVPSSESGITFQNKLKESIDFNIFNYMYFYNGAGVAVGDVNGDDLPDIYFTSNQESNKLYLNAGKLKFKDVTEIAGVAGFDSWATGVTMADVNGDGKLDIYVSYVGDYLIFKGTNQLFINEGVDKEGIPLFKNRAKEYGLDLVGFSTQASFFDYDNDGDLDMFMLNHSLHQNGTYGKANTLRFQTHPTAGDKLFKNESGKFVDVTKESGIYSSALGYGLGVVVSDVNLDGWQDIYVGNDFHENDYLYINQKNGKFKESLEQSMNHTSRYTMGVDFADFNNDAFPDLIAMDMLPDDYKRLKSSVAEDPYDTYLFKTQFGYNEQYARNALQLNNQDGTFSEIALFAGVAATDWSWSTFFADFDLDGDKDIFVSNGIFRRSNDLDYVNFISNDTIQRVLNNKMNERQLHFITKMPQEKVNNFLFDNNNDSTFTNKAEEWGLNKPSYSNGATYADLDNDGDLDIVVNNIDEVAFVYENKTISAEVEKPSRVNFLQIKLVGAKSNLQGIGTKVFLYSEGRVQMQECMPTRGFQSSVDTRLTFGTGNATLMDSLVVVWTDGSFQTLVNVKSQQQLVLRQQNASGRFNYSRFTSGNRYFVGKEDELTPVYKHVENDYVEFDRQSLMPFMVSAEGPAVAVGDVNADGLDDLYLGGAKWQKGQLLLQSKDGKFHSVAQPLIEADSTYEDVDAIFFDFDKDGDLDLFVVSGGNEFSGKSKYMSPRLYINDGRGVFVVDSQFPEVYLTGSCVAVSDFDKDGDVDIFLGARAVPGNYGIPSDSYLLENDGRGKFKDITDYVAPELRKFGFVNSATWADLNNDGYEELVVAAEWRPITVFENSKGRLSLKKAESLKDQVGWWNTIHTGDFDNDGDLDMVAGNLGLNSKLKADLDHPVRMYVNDFDKNGTIEPILTHVIRGIEFPFYTRDEITKQIPSLKKKYLSYQKFAVAEFKDFFPEETIRRSQKYTATMFESVYIENLGNFDFKIKPLPKQIQFSTANSFSVGDFNNDHNLDILVGGNFFRSNIQMGRYDASYGDLLIGDGRGNFNCVPRAETGIFFRGQVRSILPVTIRKSGYELVVVNNDSLKLLKIRK